MKSELFFEYIGNVFNPYLEQNQIKKPVVLFVDGHTTHLTFELSELCSRLQIVLICLYPNATRILQPADVAAFKPLKTGWLKAVSDWRRQHPNMQFTKANFAPLLEDVIKIYVKPKSVINGFRACGLFPWNPSAIDYSKCLGRGGTTKAPLIQNNPTIKKYMDLATFQKIIGPEETTKLEMGEISDANEIIYNLSSFFTSNTELEKHYQPPEVVNILDS